MTTADTPAPRLPSADPNPRPTREQDTRDLIETAIDVPELRQVDADVLLAVAEAVIQTVGPELERLHAEVEIRDVLIERVDREPDLCLCVDCAQIKLDKLRAERSAT